MDYIVSPANHWLYQVSNCFLILSYLTTNLLVLRLLLTCASICYCLWGALVLAISVDTTVWNGIFAIINAVQTCIILYGMRHVELHLDVEEMYSHYFGKGKLLLSRVDFKKMTESPVAQIITFPPGHIFAYQGSEAKHLSVLLSGSMQVIRQDWGDSTTNPNSNSSSITFLLPSSPSSSSPSSPSPISSYTVHQVIPLEFIDSPEYVSQKTLRGPKFDVSIICTQQCKVLQWEYGKLASFLSTQPHIDSTISALLGRDVANKLFSSQSHVYHQTKAAMVASQVQQTQIVREIAEKTMMNLANNNNNNNQLLGGNDNSTGEGSGSGTHEETKVLPASSADVTVQIEMVSAINNANNPTISLHSHVAAGNNSTDHHQENNGNTNPITTDTINTTENNQEITTKESASDSASSPLISSHSHQE